ncbi:MAG: DUF2125 domain-containing protein [Emcibacter sp.]|nr:DUF2125 domain-containing protein [Emcibacter sp.]
MRFKILVSTVLALVIGYSVFWHYMAGEIKEQIEIEIKDQKAHGLTIKYDKLSVTGFPYRMDISIDQLMVVKSGKKTIPIVFSSSNITRFSFPWKIDQGVILSSGGQLRIGEEKTPILIMNMQNIKASSDVSLQQKKIRQASIIVEKIDWTSGKPKKGKKISKAQDVRFHIMKPETTADLDAIELPALIKLYLSANDVIAQDLPVDVFGKKADHVIVDIQLHGEKWPTYSKKSLVDWRDSGGTFAINSFEVSSGKMDVELGGDITLDQDLKPLGAFTSKIHGIDHIISILSKYSIFGEEQGQQVLQELKKMSKKEKSGNFKGKDVLDLAISFQGGLLFLGPIPLYELSPVIE